MLRVLPFGFRIKKWHHCVEAHIYKLRVIFRPLFIFFFLVRRLPRIVMMKAKARKQRMLSQHDSLFSTRSWYSNLRVVATLQYSSPSVLERRATFSVLSREGIRYASFWLKKERFWTKGLPNLPGIDVILMSYWYLVLMSYWYLIPSLACLFVFLMPFFVYLSHGCVHRLFYCCTRWTLNVVSKLIWGEVHVSRNL